MYKHVHGKYVYRINRDTYGAILGQGSGGLAGFLRVDLFVPTLAISDPSHPQSGRLSPHSKVNTVKRMVSLVGRAWGLWGELSGH